MSEVERMRIELDAALRRVRRLEVYFEQGMIFHDDEREAQRVAEQMGFPVTVLLVKVKRGPGPGRAKIRCPQSKVACELRKRKWTVSRIARALHVCEDTARGWVA